MRWVSSVKLHEVSTSVIHDDTRTNQLSPVSADMWLWRPHPITSLCSQSRPTILCQLEASPSACRRYTHSCAVTHTLLTTTCQLNAQFLISLSLISLVEEMGRSLHRPGGGRYDPYLTAALDSWLYKQNITGLLP